MTKKGERTKAAKKSIQRRLPNRVTDLPTGVQKSYFMLSEAERAVLNTALDAAWASCGGDFCDQDPSETKGGDSWWRKHRK